MTPTDTITGPKQRVSERPGPALQWARYPDGREVLQQIWNISVVVDGEIKSGRTEWRDVPVVPVIGVRDGMATD